MNIILTIRRLFYLEQRQTDLSKRITELTIQFNKFKRDTENEFIRLQNEFRKKKSCKK